MTPIPSLGLIILIFALFVGSISAGAQAVPVWHSWPREPGKVRQASNPRRNALRRDRR